MKAFSILSILITLLCTSCVLSYTDFDRANSKPAEHLSEKDVNLLTEHFLEQSRKTSLPLFQVNTIFFLKDRQTGENVLFVLLERPNNEKNNENNDEYYLITTEKTYIIYDLLEEVMQNYQFIYYITDKIDVDMKGVSLFGLEEFFQAENEDGRNLIKKIVKGKMMM